MLSFFRTNQILSSILLVPFVVALHLYAFFHNGPVDLSRGGLIYNWVESWLPAQSYWPLIFSIILVSIEGVLINAMVMRHRLAREVTMIPGLIFVTIASAIPEFLFFSPLHLANLFLILGIGELMATYKKPSAAGQIFNVGFWIGMAGLCYLPYLIFLLLAFVGLNILRAFNLQERLMVASGAVVPHFLFFVYFLWNDKIDYFLDQSYGSYLAWLDYSGAVDWEFYYRIGFFALTSIMVLLSYESYMFKRNIQIHKKIHILYWNVLLGLLSILFVKGLQFDHFLILTIPLGILLSFNFTMMGRRASEGTFLFVLILIFFLQYKAFFIPS